MEAYKLRKAAEQEEKEKRETAAAAEQEEKKKREAEAAAASATVASSPSINGDSSLSGSPNSNSSGKKRRRRKPPPINSPIVDSEDETDEESPPPPQRKSPATIRRSPLPDPIRLPPVVVVPQSRIPTAPRSPPNGKRGYPARQGYKPSSESEEESSSESEDQDAIIADLLRSTDDELLNRPFPYKQKSPAKPEKSTDIAGSSSVGPPPEVSPQQHIKRNIVKDFDSSGSSNGDQSLPGLGEGQPSFTEAATAHAKKETEQPKKPSSPTLPLGADFGE